MRSRKSSYVFTSAEIAMLMLAASKLDPKHYPSPKMKSLIYKCKAVAEDDDIHFRITSS